ncbi:MAG TPA: carboxymuconolactone decarboxylase family protein [Mycobacteriales bacterium]|nr:carboxymuconolactone decarboxylase family protein [Mycobacteriales bacterium]
MTPRLQPVPKHQWDEDCAAAVRAGMPAVAAERFLSLDADAPRLANGITTLLHHPQLAAKFLSFNGHLLWEPVLSPRLRELVVLRVARRTRSPYEWVQHVKLSQRYDVTPAEVDAIANDDDAVFSDLEADVLRATDQLLETYRVEDDTWERLAEGLDEKTLVELLFVVGTYTALAMVFNGLGVELDPDLDPSIAPALPED